MIKNLKYYCFLIIILVLFYSNITVKAISIKRGTQTIACYNGNTIAGTADWKGCGNGGADVIANWKFDDNTSAFCLDHGHDMKAGVSFSTPTTITDSGIACGIYDAYNELRKNYSVDEAINKINAKEIDNGTYAVIQTKLWNKQHYSGTCGNTILYESPGSIQLTATNNNFELSLNNDGTYYVSNKITVTRQNLSSTEYNISVSGPVGTYVTTTPTSTTSVTSSDSSELYIKVPANQDIKSTDVTLNITSKDKSTRITGNASVDIYTHSNYVSTNSNTYQRMGKVSLKKSQKNYNKTASLKLKIKTCSSMLNDLGESPSRESLLDLYKYYLNRHKENRNLLNFSNPSCGNPKNNYSKKMSCLSGNFGQSQFNQNNLSNFNEKIDINGTPVFCLTSFTLDNKLGTSVFSSFKGQMPIQYPDQTVVATGTVTKKCYVSGGNELTADKVGKYSDYVESINFENKPLTVKNDKEGISEADGILEKNIKESSGNWYVYSKKIDYYLNPIYATIGKGEIKDTECTNCRFLGYGIISKFNDKDSIEIPFSIKLKQKEEFKFDSIEYEDKCEAKLTEQLIKSDKLDLEFRLIDTSNPFPGKSANGRKVGRNWCSDTNCQNNNDLITEVISNKPNSYGRIPSTKESKDPIYKIKLTSKTIKEIREYNKNNPYDDYTLKCDSDGNNCESTFLKDKGMTRLS